jgi:tetratricopeptide (TPR) repeat protein
MDYLRNGLIELPLSPELLYNYACANILIYNNDIALIFFQFARYVRNGWSDAYFGESVANFKLKNFKEAKKCVKIALKCHKTNSIE